MNENCDNYSTCGNNSVLIIPGYYHGERLCNICLKKKIVKCNKCQKLLGYVLCGSTLDKSPHLSKAVCCSKCIQTYFK
jgi:hypothetical protein